MITCCPATASRGLVLQINADRRATSENCFKSCGQVDYSYIHISHTISCMETIPVLKGKT